MTRAPRGMLLLEVMLGTTILGIAAVALVTLLNQTVETVRLGREAERRVIAANETMNRASVWSASALDAHIGTGRVGVWNVEVSMVAPQLYAVAIYDTLSDAVVLRTVMYRSAAALHAH